MKEGEEEDLVKVINLITALASTVSKGELRKSVEVCLLAALRIILDEGGTLQEAYEGVDTLLTVLAERTGKLEERFLKAEGK